MVFWFLKNEKRQNNTLFHLHCSPYLHFLIDKRIFCAYNDNKITTIYLQVLILSKGGMILSYAGAFPCEPSLRSAARVAESAALRQIECQSAALFGGYDGASDGGRGIFS